jgi:glutamate racemase
MSENAERIKKPTLAILDWGIGGMDFYRIFKEHYPETGVCYFSDSGAVPYGKQQKGQLAQRLDHMIKFLKPQGISRLVVACNAMSTVLPELAQRESMKDFQITGVIEPAISAVLRQNGERVGIVGGCRTIRSGAYGKPLRKHFPSVAQRIAQPLSAMIERGEKDTPLFHETLNRIMQPLKKTDILVLACTHYPAVRDAFQALAPGSRLVSPSEETFQWVERHWPIKKNQAADVIYTTGNPDEMRSSSFTAFDVNIGEIITLPAGITE